MQLVPYNTAKFFPKSQNQQPIGGGTLVVIANVDNRSYSDRTKFCAVRVWSMVYCTLQWHHNEHDGISNHKPHGCLLDNLFRSSSKKISNLRITGLCEVNSPVTGEFPTQRASNAENISIWWCHHELPYFNRYPVLNDHTIAGSLYIWLTIWSFSIHPLWWNGDLRPVWQVSFSWEKLGQQYWHLLPFLP